MVLMQLYILKIKNPDYFNLLSKYCARFEYNGDKGAPSTISSIND